MQLPMNSNLDSASELVNSLKSLKLDSQSAFEVKEYNSLINKHLFQENNFNFPNSISTFRVISWNINGKNIKNSANTRRSIIQRFMDNYQPDIIFLQENPWGPYKGKPTASNRHLFLYNPQLYGRMDSQDSGKLFNSILYNRNIFQHTPLSIPLPEPPTYLTRSGKGLWNTMKGRAVFCCLRFKDPISSEIKDFYLCNLHCIRQMDDESIKVLCAFLQHLTLGHNLPVAVAGDFNFDIQQREWAPLGWFISVTPLVVERKHNIDGMLFYRRFSREKNQQFFLRNVCCLSFSEWIEDKDELAFITNNKIFDHVPLYAFLCYSTQTQLAFL